MEIAKQLAGETNVEIVNGDPAVIEQRVVWRRKESHRSFSVEIRMGALNIAIGMCHILQAGT